MPKYMKKPKVITAEQFDGTEESLKRINQLNPSSIESTFRNGKLFVWVYTLNGRVDVLPGDWVLWDEENDDIWPCNGEIFKKNYTEVSCLN